MLLATSCTAASTALPTSLRSAECVELVGSTSPLAVARVRGGAAVWEGAGVVSWSVIAVLPQAALRRIS